MRVVGIIEARMGSSRLPGKTLMSIYEGRALLDLVVTRFRYSLEVDDVVVATTLNEKDDPIVHWCDDHDVSCFRGSEDDVLDRVCAAAEMYKADAIVQMGADSAYLDYTLVDELVGYYRRGKYDYVCNDMRLTYPLGIYAHVVGMHRLCELNGMEGLSQSERSDVVRYIWEHPELYRILNVEAENKLAYPQLRLTIDYPEDMTLAKVIYHQFGCDDFTTLEIISLYHSSPNLFTDVGGLVQQSAPFLASQ